MSQIAVIAKIPAKPGQRDQLRDALADLIANTADEAGTLMYLLHEDQSDENLLWMYELYTDQAALDVHMASPGFKAGGAKLVPFLGGRPELVFTKPTGGKGLPG
jgi:quinol monooxygenase YgiN